MRIATALFTAFLLAFQPGAALALTPPVYGTPTAQEQRQDAEFNRKAIQEREAAAKKQAAGSETAQLRLKTKILKAIDRRIGEMRKLTSRLAQLKRLSDDSREIVKTKIQAEIDALTKLRAEVDAITDAETLRAQAQTLRQDYKTFAFLMPQVHTLAASDSISLIAAKLETVHGKLRKRVTAAGEEGKDTVALEQQLSEMRQSIVTAKDVAANVKATVIALDPAAFPDNKETILQAREQIRTAREAIRQAHRAGQGIISSLKALGLDGKSSAASTAAPTVKSDISPSAETTASPPDGE